MKRKVILIFFIIAISQSLACLGQNVADSVKTFRIETNDGNIYIGCIIAEDSSILELRTENLGEIKIPQITVKSRIELKDFKKIGSNLWLPNPQSSRYFWAPNGYGLEGGSSYYQNIWVLYNQFSFGVSKTFSLGAGMLPLFLFSSEVSPVWIVPKLSIPVVKDKFNIGTGAFIGTLMGEEGGSFGLLYATATVGSRDKNFSCGFAYGYAGDQWLKVPVINLSGMVRTGPKGYLITENYIITAEGSSAVIISAGGRSIIRNIGLDYSLWIPINAGFDTFIAVPFLGITVPIGKRK